MIITFSTIVLIIVREKLGHHVVIKEVKLACVEKNAYYSDKNGLQPSYIRQIIKRIAHLPKHYRLAQIHLYRHLKQSFIILFVRKHLLRAQLEQRRVGKNSQFIELDSEVFLELHLGHGDLEGHVEWQASADWDPSQARFWHHCFSLV